MLNILTQICINKENIDLHFKASLVNSERCVCDIILPSHLSIIIYFLSLFESFEKTVGEDIAHNDQFLLFPPSLLPCWRTFTPFSSNLELVSSEESKFCRFGTGLMCLLLDTILEIQEKLQSIVLAGAIKHLSILPVQNESA